MIGWLTGTVDVQRWAAITFVIALLLGGAAVGAGITVAVEQNAGPQLSEVAQLAAERDECEELGGRFEQRDTGFGPMTSCDFSTVPSWWPEDDQ